MRIPDRAAVAAAEAAIRPHIRETPVIATAAADFGLAGLPVVFKLEFMQHSGNFKARGAFTNLVMRQGTERGVVAASGGNHGAAVAYAAMKLGIPAHVFVPSISSPAKIARIQSYGADIAVGGDSYADALAASRAFATARDLPELHAYDQFETVAGQGTLALEWERQSPGLDTLVVAVGGGGLVGGIAAATEGRMKLVAVEPERAPSLHEALRAGHPVDAPVGGIAADSLGARRLGDIAFGVLERRPVTPVLVTDEAILSAQKVLWDVLHVVVEPGGAAAMAALLSGRYVPAPGERLGVLLCGANTTAVGFG